MTKFVASLLISVILLTKCTPAQLNLAQTIINDIVAFLPLITDLLSNSKTKSEAVTIMNWVDRNTVIANDILSNPTKAGYLQAASDFTANVLPALPNLSPAEIQGLTNISIDIQTFIKSNPPQTNLTAKVLGAATGTGISKGDLKKISEMKIQIQGIRNELNKDRILANK